MKIPMFALPHRVTIVPFIGSGAYGPIWETDQTKFKNKVPCRIEPQIRRIQGTNGDDVVQQATGIFHPNWKINQNDRIVWNDLEFTVETVIPIDAMGPHSIEVILT